MEGLIFGIFRYLLTVKKLNCRIYFNYLNVFFFLATGPVSLQINDLSDPPKKQDSVNEVREKFAQLRRLRDELQNALFRWISKRRATIRLLKSLAVGSQVTVQNRLFEVAEAAFPVLSATMSSIFRSALGTATASFTFGTIETIMELLDVVKIVGSKLGLGFNKVQASIKEDEKACLEIQQQLDSLENFISTLAEFLIPLNDNAVLLKEMGESGFEFLYKWIACEDMDPLTVTKVEFYARFLRAATSASTMSSSILDIVPATVFVSEVAGADAMARSEARCETIRTGTPLTDIANKFPVIKYHPSPLAIAFFVESSRWNPYGSASEIAEDIRWIVNRLECPYEEEIQSLVQSFIEGSFNKAYRLIESDKLRE